jgi:hypothetical protein
MKKLIKEVCTDALGRWEPKMLIGIPALIIGLLVGLVGVCKFRELDWLGWGSYISVCVGLIVTTAVTDAKIDAKASDKDSGQGA